MKKRMLLGALCAVALTSVATACGGGEKVYGDVSTEINIWATAKEQPVIKAIVDEYNSKQKEETNKFKYKFTAVSEADAGTTLAKDPTIKDAPALVLCADDHIYNLASKNIVSEVKGEFLTGINENNTPVSITGATYNNKVYGFPVTSDNGYFLWYNSAALQGEQITSLEKLLEAAKAQKKTVGFAVNDGWYANSFLMSPQACGTKSLSWTAAADGKVSYQTNWDNEVGVKVSTYIGSLLKPYYDSGTLLAATNDVIEAGFKDGTMIAGISGTWMEDPLKEACSTIAATKLPEYHIDGIAYQMASFTGSKVYVLNKTRPVAEQKVAAALAELLTNKNSQLVRFEQRSTIPSNKAALEDERYTKNVSISAKALGMQNEFAAVQSQSAQDRYWDIGKAIGQAYLDGNEDWAGFLKEQMDILRKAQ